MTIGVFIDRDGVIVEDPGYVHRLEDFKLIPNAIKGLKLLNNCKLFIITNQSGIGRGIYTTEDFLKFNNLLINELEKNNDSISTTSVNTFEILRGFIKIKDQKRMDLVIDFLNSIEISYFDFESSKKAAEIFEELKTQGEMIELPDIMIASIAISHDEPILTRNIKHFQKIKNLKIEKI